MHAQFQARLLFAAAGLSGALPWPVLRGIAFVMARGQLWRNTREARVARRSLELAFPQMEKPARDALLRETLRATAMQMLQTLSFWTQAPARNLQRITRIEGQDLFDAAAAAKRGLIISAPHHGNWELLNQWLAAQGPLAILYKPPESAMTEAFLRRVRAVGGSDQVTQVRAEGPAIRTLLKTLMAGGVVGILPDQQPKAGDGVFAPFFATPALTMTLVNRLSLRTGATVLHAVCERIGNTPDYSLRIVQGSADIASGHAVEAAHALNEDIAQLVHNDPRQYQWTYKRYALQPEGSPLGNPYWPDCYT